MFVVALCDGYRKYIARKDYDEMDDDEPDGDYGDDDRRRSRFFTSFSSLWATARKNSIVRSWVPANPLEMIEFPSELLVTYVQILPVPSRKKRPGRPPLFTVYKARLMAGEDGADQLHHVTLTLGSDGERVSVFRSKTYQEAMDLYQSCVACERLFYMIGESGDASTNIPLLLAQLIKHPLWQSVHVAAVLGFTAFFKSIQKKGQISMLHTVTKPEGLLPLMIAIENNNIELVKLMIEMGADLLAIDNVGNNIIHFAALSSPEMLDLLWEHELTHNMINAVNVDGYGPLLYAIRHANARCSAKLAMFGAQLKLLGGGGVNPLFTAMQSTWHCVDVIKALLDSSPDLINETDPMTGNRVVHAALSKKPLTALLILKGGELDLNARNMAGQTALHVYAFRGDLGCVMSLASNNADLDAVDDNGDTALHIAVASNNLIIVRALLCLGANVNIENHAGDTPRHVAAKFHMQDRSDLLHSLKICGANRCDKGKVGCREGCAHDPIDNLRKQSAAYALGNGTVDSWTIEDAQDAEAAMVEDSCDAMPATREANVHEYLQQSCYMETMELLEDEEKRGRMINLLTLDGGGIRGLVLIQLLLAIEEKLEDSVIDYFDWVAGTSTGGILAVGLAQGKSLRECQHLYLRFKDYIFDTWARPYNTLALEAFLQTELGTNTTLADMPWPRVLLTTVIGDVSPIKLQLLRNYQLALTQEDNEALGFERPEDWEVWKALRCTSAAPTFFCSVEGKYIDGGLVANNPNLELLSEVHLFNAIAKYNAVEKEPLRIGCMLSIGTGVLPKRQLASVDVDSFSNLFANILAMKNLGIILLDQVTATEGAPIDRSRSWCHSMGVPLLRLSAPLTNDVQIDEKGDAEIVEMLWDCMEYTHRHRQDIAELVDLLRLSGKSKQRRHLFD